MLIPRPGTRRRRCSAFAVIAATSACLATAYGAQQGPVAPATNGARQATVAMQPYKARYQVSYRGISGGEIEATFKPGPGNGQWLYETRAFPNLLARIAVSPQARERSTMLITPSGVQPLTYDFNDGSEDSNKDLKLSFDWSTNRLSGQSKGRPFEIEVTPGTQDTASVQAAMIMELLAGRSPTGFHIVTGNKARDYRYWSEGPQQVMTPYGQVQAVVWASQGPKSDRVSKVWHAPSLGFVPVQAVQYRKGSPEVQMKLVSLER